MLKSRTNFNFLFSMFRLCGMSFRKEKSSKLYTVYEIILVFSVYSTCLAMFLDVIDKRHDLNLFMRSLRVFLPELDHVWLYNCLRFRQRSVERLISVTESFTWNDLPARHPDTGHLTMAGMIPRVTSISKFFFLMVAFFHCIQSSIRIIRYHENIFSTWYPFDTSSSPYYELVLFLQAIDSLFSLSMVISFSTFYVVLLCTACSQLEKLNNNLLKIRTEHFALTLEQKIDRQEKNTEEDRFTTQEVYQRMQGKLNECVLHHQEITEYMRQLEKTMNFPLSGHFLILFAILCFSAFSAVMSLENYSDLSQAIMIYLTFIFIILLFCWFGTQLTIQAENVRDGAYGCGWIGTPVPFQKCIVLIIARASDEFTLTAGKFVPVSNKTFMSIMKETLSFFMFLLEVKKRIDEPIQ